MASRFAQVKPSAVARCPVPSRSIAACACKVSKKSVEESLVEVSKFAAVNVVASQLLVAGNASAAQEVATMAGDNRLGLVLTVLVPALGWGLFNIAGPLFDQIDSMSGKNKAIIGGLGLSAALLSGGSADAAQEVATMAGDNRLGLVLTVLVPALGWGLFNIAGPLFDQIDSMSGKNKAIIGGLGLSAALLSGGSADAAQEVATMAGDNRLGLVLTVLLPALGWGLFNIAGPLFDQIDSMSEKNKAIIGGTGLSAALLSGGSVEAAQEVATVAGDNRLGLVLTVLVPALGWGLFNIAGPALDQYNGLKDKN